MSIEAKPKGARVLGALAIAAAIGGPATAQAQFVFTPTTGGIADAYLRAQCANPTLEDCQDNYYLNRCLNVAGNDCRQILESEAGRQYDGLGDVELRKAAADGSFGYDAADSKVDESEEPITHSPDWSSYNALRDWWKKSVQAGNTRMFDNATDSWDDSGIVVDSCFEYTYEKFYDISAFEDATFALEEDYRGIYDVAFGPPGDPASIGTRHRSGYCYYGYCGHHYLRSKDVRSTIGRFMAGDQRVKNSFFKVSEGAPDTDNEAMRLLRQSLSSRVRGIMNKIDANYSTASETFNWHHAQSRALETASRPPLRTADGGLIRTGYLDEELNHLFDLQERFDAVFQDYMNVYAETTARTMTLGDAAFVRCVNTPQGPLCNSPSFGAQDARRLAQDLVTYRNMVAEEMAGLMREANELGCFESGTTPCDWSPKLFASRIADQYAGAMEEAYMTCVSKVPNANNFASLKNLTLDTEAMTEEFSYQVQGDFTVSTRALENYFREFDKFQEMKKKADEQWAAARLSEHEALVDESGEIKAPGFSKAGGSSLGGKYFGVGYGYQMSWGTGNWGDVCEVHVGFKSSFNAEVEVFNQKKDLVNAFADINLKEAKAELVLLGKEIYSEQQDLVEGNSAWNFSAGHAEEVGKDEWQVSTTVYVMGIPVNLGMGAFGRYGFEAEFGVRTIGLDNYAECQRNGMGAILEATARPWIGATGQAWVALGNDLAKVGVKGEVDIITASLPASVEVTLSTRDDALTIDTELNLDLETLDGRMYLFAEAGWGLLSVDKKIASWDGLHEQVNLQDEEFEVSLDDMITVFRD